MGEDTSIHIAYSVWCLVAKLLLVKTLFFFFPYQHSANANHVSVWPRQWSVV